VLQADVGSLVTGKETARLFEDDLPTRLVDEGGCLQCLDGQGRMGIRYQELAAAGVDLLGLNLIWWHGCCKILG